MSKGRWRHVSCLDVDILITKVVFAGPVYIKAKVFYVDRRNQTFYNNFPETVKIKRKDFDKWTYID